MAFNLTKNTWSQIANKQASTEASIANLNANAFNSKLDPVYGKLIEQISYTMYRKLQVTQKLANLGRTAPMNSYPGILREVYMSQRKGQNYAQDNGERATTLGAYDIYDDKIDVRYHSAQFRWMYPWTLYDEELRRYSGGSGEMIAQLAEMKMMNCINARNLFMDSLRKQTMYLFSSNYATTVQLDDITDFETLTAEKARAWLNEVDNILWQMQYGTALYTSTEEYIQTPKSELQMVMPRDFYKNVIRRAYPDMYNNESYLDILPENLILVDSLGGDTLYNHATSPAPVPASYNDVGMSTINWTAGDTTKPGNENAVALIMHRDCIGFEDNLNETLFGNKDIEKLATPVRSHFWTKAYCTDLLPAVLITKAGE